MGSKICMNGLCGATTSHEWKKGWAMKSGGYSTLCYSCGTAYENVIYCERFHLNEPGWRECNFCKKPIHCGCVVSKYLHEYLDLGGIACILCLRTIGSRSTRPVPSSYDDVPNGFAAFATLDRLSPVVGTRVNGAIHDRGKLLEHSEAIDKQWSYPSTSSCHDNPTLTNGRFKQEENFLPAHGAGNGFSSLEGGSIFPHVSPKSNSFPLANIDNSTPKQGIKDIYESLGRPSLRFSLSGSIGVPDSKLPTTSGVVEGRERDNVPPFKQGQRTRHIFPKSKKTGLSIRSNPETRVPRPPAEGRGRQQLLPRYWPRITDQELEQISGDLKSTIVPLFEKVLSASDAGRIGRLVLPKACAEAYFPPISQSDGIPLRIQDIKGKEWTFQFRFWPNNNSRMYVLEGVTPCIQSMQLQAGDTVIFSRLDPGGKLVIGCRKTTTTSADTKDAEASDLPNGHPGVNGVQSPKMEEQENKSNGNLSQPATVPIKKKSRNISSKSKRLHMRSEEAVELSVTWVEAQELFRPPPHMKPSIVVVENCEFEEYVDPPIFGKKTIFTSRASGEQEQWGQCDSCRKWRKLPLDILLPPKWTCSNNIWDPRRSLCSAPEDISEKELEHAIRVSNDSKRRRITEDMVEKECEPSGLDALAMAAVLGDNVDGEFADPSAEMTTTKHPRHRPGCTCIVCIQPPSGKGKHKSSCICTACLSVKRRFKTLMLKKKKRIQEREAELAREKEPLAMDDLENEEQNMMEMEMGEPSNGDQLDLNFNPSPEMTLAEAEVANALLHSSYSVQDLVSGSRPCLPSRAAAEAEACPPCLLSEPASEIHVQPQEKSCKSPTHVEAPKNKGDEG